MVAALCVNSCLGMFAPLSGMLVRRGGRVAQHTRRLEAEMAVC